MQGRAGKGGSRVGKGWGRGGEGVAVGWGRIEHGWTRGKGREQGRGDERTGGPFHGRFNRVAKDSKYS